MGETEGGVVEREERERQSERNSQAGREGETGE